MDRKVGLWIDHSKAVIVSVTDESEQTSIVNSNMEKHVRFSAGSGSQHGSAEDQRDRQFTNHLGRFYDDVLASIRDADSILIFGPGEAKGELQKRLERDALGARIVGVEAADKMTDRQIAAKVRERFPKKKRGRKQ